MQDLSKDKWDKKYLENNTPWDMNQAAPSLISYFKDIDIENKRIAVLGCGKGHDAFYLSELGGNVDGYDFASSAINFCNEKKIKRKIKNLSFYNEDFFNLVKNENLNNYYDYVIEHKSFCAIAPNKRGEYIDLIYYLLKPSGKLVGIFFIDNIKRESPPFSITKSGFNTLINKLFIKKSDVTLAENIKLGISLDSKEYFYVLEPVKNLKTI